MIVFPLFYLLLILETTHQLHLIIISNKKEIFDIDRITMGVSQTLSSHIYQQLSS